MATTASLQNDSSHVGPTVCVKEINENNKYWHTIEYMPVLNGCNGK